MISFCKYFFSACLPFCTEVYQWQFEVELFCDHRRNRSDEEEISMMVHIWEVDDVTGVGTLVAIYNLKVVAIVVAIFPTQIKSFSME